MHQHAAGFTLVELVVVLVLLGILSAYAAPSFSGRSGYSELTAQQDVKQAIRYAQQLAMSRTAESFSFVSTANQVDIARNGVPIAANGYPKIIPSDVTLSDSNLTFDRLGTTADVDITVTGSAQVLTVRVIGITGYAYDL